MLRIILSGCNGKMGRVITACADEREDCEIVAGVDVDPVMLSHYPVFRSFADIHVDADVIIDFSHPSALPGLLGHLADTHLPAVIATTGFDEAQTALIRTAALTSPVFFSFNMSLGVNLLLDLVKKAAAVLGDSFDIEIIEAHHNQKIDAPSGTALMIADAVNSALNEPCRFEYDRHSRRGKREKREIGIHAVRGGTIVGEHEVLFAGRDELVTISHSARSKEIFAVGALEAAHFLFGKPSGLYTMSDLVASK